MEDYELAVGNESETVDTVARLRANYARSLAAGVTCGTPSNKG